MELLILPSINSNLQLTANFQLIQISYNPDCPGLPYSSRPNPVGSDDTHNYYEYAWQSDPNICVNIYDALLLEWSHLNLQSSVEFGAQGTFYCNSSLERQYIIDTFGWEINDNGLNCETVDVIELEMPNQDKVCIKTIDLLGRKSNNYNFGVLIDIYNDGSSIKRLNTY